MQIYFCLLKCTPWEIFPYNEKCAYHVQMSSILNPVFPGGAKGLNLNSYCIFRLQNK